MHKNQVGNIGNIAILEAVLTMGQTLDLDKECVRFLEILTSMGYTHVNIQIKDGEFHKCVKSPKKVVTKHKVIKFSFDDNTLLSEIKGFVEIHKETDFTAQELKHIDILIKKFQSVIAACLCHKRAVREAELRQEVEEHLRQARTSIERLSIENQSINKELDIRITKYTEEFEETIKRLKEIALRDSMTGLYNRGHILTLGKKAFEESIVHNKEFSVIMLDIDNFKVVNDTYGHLVGDQVIEILGKRLENSVKSKDLVGRYGGEEFIIFLFCNKLAAKAVGERVRHAIGSRVFVIKNKTEDEFKDSIRLPVTISVGVATRMSKDKTLESLIERADKMLYKAKAAGKNKVITG